MRIVIDLQGSQTESRFRGIGRYSLSLAKAIVRNRGDHEIIIALSGLFPDSIEPIRSEFDGLLPNDCVRVWYAPGPVAEIDPDNVWRREAAELIREAFLASLRPDVVHIMSVFEGYYDDAVTSLGLFDQSTPTTISLYDLIPLLQPDLYLEPDPNFEKYYLRKVNYLHCSPLLFSISDYTGQEGAQALGRNEASIVSISTAVDSCFQEKSFSESQIKSVLDKFGLRTSFILYAGGSDQRKNLPSLIQAFSLLPKELQSSHQLVFAGKMPEADCHMLIQEAASVGLDPDLLNFTGYVSDPDLVDLYNLCTLFVLPSRHEGFGLPALEAMSCGAAVIAANTTSLPEVVGSEDALFDPFSIQSIAEKMTQALTDEAFRTKLQQYGHARANLFSWDRCAVKAINAFEHLHKQRQQKVDWTLIRALAKNDAHHPDGSEFEALAQSIAKSFPAMAPALPLLEEESSTCRTDLKASIKRVARSTPMLNICGTASGPLNYQIAEIQASLSVAYEQNEALETRRNEAEARQSDMQVQVAKALENAIQQDELLREKDQILGETTSQLKESQEFLRVKEQELEQATATLLESKGLLGAKEQELEQATATLLEQQALLRDGEHKQRETLESLEIEKAHRQKKKAELLAVHRALSRTDLELRGTLDELQQLRQSSVHLKSETDKRIDQLENALRMTTLELEQNRTELLNLYASKSWKITWPLRKAQDAAKWVVKWPAKLFATHRKAVDNDGHSPTNPETPVQDVSPNQNSEHVTPRARATDKIVAPEATINMFMARIQAELELREERMEDPDREISA